MLSRLTPAQRRRELQRLNNKAGSLAQGEGHRGERRSRIWIGGLLKIVLKGINKKQECTLSDLNHNISDEGQTESIPGHISQSQITRPDHLLCQPHLLHHKVLQTRPVTNNSRPVTNNSRPATARVLFSDHSSVLQKNQYPITRSKRKIQQIRSSEVIDRCKKGVFLTRSRRSYSGFSSVRDLRACNRKRRGCPAPVVSPLRPVYTITKLYPFI